MADDEHLSILKQAAEAWNWWRANKLGSNIQPDFSGADLSGADLRGADLYKANLNKATLINTRLCWADLRGADLSEANLGGADLSNAHANGANLGKVNLSGADLRWANLSGTCLREALCSQAHFSMANLSAADLKTADLSQADLKGTVLVRAYLSMVNLSMADLRGADLYEADLTGASLIDTNVEGAEAGFTKFGDVDLSVAKGLETVIHRGPSTIGVDTIYRSKGKIPEIFLRGTGVPDTMIAYIASLIDQHMQYHPCFISYSTKDQDFAQRLHADLQSKGIRCWFAPEDLKIGDKFRTRIDEAIHLYNKLLLILSERSIQSDWVEKEVETAYEKERLRGQTVLFPIRLDDAVMQTNQAWAADIRRTRHIGDFRHWKDNAAYQKAFDRLLHDLQAGDA